MINNYKYTAVTRERKTVKGQMQAPNKEILANFLYEKGMTLKEVKEHNSMFAFLNGINIGKVINEVDMIFLLKQLGAMIKAGMRSAEAVEVLATQTKNKQIRSILFDVYFNVHAGMYLSEAMAKHPNEFPKLMTNMINNGETSGDLVQAIENIATYYEDNRQVRMDIIGALTMPALYIVMGIVVTAVMIVFVLPNYVTLFASTGATLPAPTQILLNIGEFFTNYYLVLAGLFLAGAVGFYAYFIKTENGRRTLSKILIKMPVFGEVVIMYNLSTIASTLNQMVRNKMKLLDAIAASTKIIRNTIYREIMEKTVENVSNGYPISMAMDDHYAFTPVFTKMISLGERSGSLTEMLQNLAQFNREDVKLRVTRLKKSIEPAIMIFIYALAGGLVMAIMLPSLTMIS
jgi:type IV pilus assembly protein PilC